MARIILEIKSFIKKGPAPYGVKGSRSGFVLLFAVMLSSIILAVSLGVVNIAFKEIKFATSAKDTNDAFFAADTGAECGLFNEKSPTKFPIPNIVASFSINCEGQSIPVVFSSGIYSFMLTRLGSSGQSCAKIFVDKTDSPTKNKLISKGYNNGSDIPNAGICTPGINSVERVLELNY